MFSVETCNMIERAGKWPAMDSAIKRRWVSALRSGVYPQGVGKLRMNGKYCCLGVLCDIQHRWQEQRDAALDSVLHWKLREQVGLGEPFDQMILATMNDEEKMSFDEIANWIEENL